MSEPTDFVDGDPFDPVVASRAEDQAYEQRVEQDEEVQRFIRRRKEAYSRVFNTEACSADDLEFVMRDLAHFCRSYRPTCETDTHRQYFIEGRRDVFFRIMDHTRLSYDTLFTKYTDAQMQQRK